MLFLRSCFLPKFSHIFRTVPPRLTSDFFQSANGLCHRIFQSMLPYISLISICNNFISTLTMVAHLFLICVLSNSVHILPPLPNNFPVSSRFLILSPQSHYKIFSLPMTPIRPLSFLLHFHSMNFTLPFGIIWFSGTTLFSACQPLSYCPSALKPKLQHFLYGFCYDRSLTAFQRSLSLLNDPIRTAHYYTILGSMWFQNSAYILCLISIINLLLLGTNPWLVPHMPSFAKPSPDWSGRPSLHYWLSFMGCASSLKHCTH